MFGVLHLSSWLKAHGHETHLLIKPGPKELAQELDTFQPQLAAFSLVTMHVPWARQCTTEIKNIRPETLVAWGGTHPTFFPECVNYEGVDLSCVGEGEYALLRLMNHLNEHDTAPPDLENCWVQNGDGAVARNQVGPQVPNLNELPYPDRALYYDRYPYLRDNPVKPVLTGRGCPFKCSFCLNESLRLTYRDNGQTLRIKWRSPENVVGEIQELRARWPLKRIHFQDETFMINKGHLAAFLPLYKKEVGLPFFCQLRADLMDDDMVKMLKDAGCDHTTFGVETGDETIRATLLRKKAKDDDFVRAASLLRKHGITFHTTNIFGFPGETFENAVNTVRFNIRLKSNSVIGFLFQPYLNLELTDYAVKNGYVDPDSLESAPMNSFKTSLLEQKDMARIEKLQKYFNLAVRFPRLLPLIVNLTRLPGMGLPTAAFVLTNAVAFYRRNRHNLWFMLKSSPSLWRQYRTFFES